MTLSMNELLKDAQRIREFRGDDTYALTSFIREVETIFAISQSNPEAREYVYQRVVLNKIQGEALHVLRTLGLQPSWEETREALISNFGVKESYHQLYQEAFAAKNVGITNYYKRLREILCKINEKYEYDNEKPIEFNNVNAEKIILKTFMNNIDVNFASVLINRNVTKLREAYNLLEREGLIRQPERGNMNRTEYNYGNRNFNFQNTGNRNSDTSGSNVNPNRQVESGNFGSNRSNINNSNPRRYGNSSQRFNNNSRNSYPIQNYSSNINYNNSQNTVSRNSTGNGPYNNNYRQDMNSQMEVDHFQEGNINSFEQEQVNFHMAACRRHFQ